MSKLTGLSWLAALCVASVGGHALAQAKPAVPPAAPVAAPAAKPAPAPAAPAAKPAPPAAPAAPAAMSCQQGCPMHEALEIADMQVEQTPQGAVIKLVAKKPEDVQKVQQLAAKLGAEGVCPMHGDMHHPHGGMMQHHHHGPPAAAPPAAAPKK